MEHGLRVDIMAPSPEAPSMTMALEKYIAKANKEIKEPKEKYIYTKKQTNKRQSMWCDNIIDSCSIK